jgi:2-amino-4-hydroxy-6-hydroxymethyldihydropteridine diphosphokinase
MKQDVFLSLGSNIGNPKDNIETAIAKLKKNRLLDVEVVSRFYLTAPVDFIEQPRFVNCVVWLKTDLEPVKLHRITRKIEKEIGPEREFDKGPRKIDIDIVLFGDLVIISNKLRIPHPRMHKRKFVLVPMVEVNKNFIHPEMNQTVEELLNNLPYNPLETVELLG